MGDLTHVKVGDMLMVPSFQHGWKRSRVVKVGRKYLHVDCDRERYERTTGHRTGGYGGTAVTPEEHARIEEHVTLMRKMTSFGVYFDHNCKLTRDQRNDVARAVVTLVAAPAAEVSSAAPAEPYICRHCGLSTANPNKECMPCTLL